MMAARTKPCPGPSLCSHPDQGSVIGSHFSNTDTQNSVHVTVPHPVITHQHLNMLNRQLQRS